MLEIADQPVKTTRSPANSMTTSQHQHLESISLPAVTYPLM